MQLLGDRSWVISASDLSKWAACPWLVARTADEKLGKGIRVPEVHDPMLELVARLGLRHEARTLEELRGTLERVVEIEFERHARPSDAEAWRAEMAGARAATEAALAGGADAVFQATLFQEHLEDAPIPVGFQGFADFLVTSTRGWEVWDTKLARSAKDSALIQLAAYVDQLRRRGIPTSPDVHLVLGDGTHSIHDVDEIMPEYLGQREALVSLLQERMVDPEATPWADERYVACGTSRCPACSEQIPMHDDLFGIAGLRKTQRSKLRVAGFATMADFAAASRDEVRTRVFGIGKDTLAALHLQASLQVATRSRIDGTVAWQITSQKMLDRIPEPNPGDVFFDFEGDPTYQEFDDAGRPLGGLAHGDESVWFGIEYLFGLWGEGMTPGSDDPFRPIWSETFDEESAALSSFCELILERHREHPGMRVYHYASYEKTKLLQLAKRHQVAESEVAFIIDNLLVDLYPIVMKGIAVGLPSYSLKSLEALYFDPETRTGIAGGGESVVAFADYLEARDRGDELEAHRLRESILHYNRIDCYSTLALREWLRGVRGEAS